MQNQDDNTRTPKNCVVHELPHFEGNSTTSRREGGEGSPRIPKSPDQHAEAGAWESAAAPRGADADSHGEVPALDANRLNVTTRWIGARRVHLAKDFLRAAGYAIRASHLTKGPQDRSSANAVFVTPKGSQYAKLIQIVLDCNGIVMLKDTLLLTDQEKQARDFQGKQNFLPLRFRAAYGEPFWLQQVAAISSRVEEARRNLMLACGEAANPSLTHKHHELTWDRTVSQDGAEAEFLRCFRIAQSLYPLMRLERKKGEGIKCVCEIGHGFRLAIYLKSGDLLRLEVRFKDEFFDKDREWRAVREAHPDFEYRIGFLRARAWKIVKPVLGTFDRAPDTVIECTATDAFMALVSVTRNPKLLLWLIHSFRQNDGRLMVRAVEKTKYRVARELFHRSILLPHVRSEYRLAPGYRSILQLHGTALHALVPELRHEQEVADAGA